MGETCETKEIYPATATHYSRNMKKPLGKENATERIAGSATKHFTTQRSTEYKKSENDTPRPQRGQKKYNDCENLYSAPPHPQNACTCLPCIILLAINFTDAWNVSKRSVYHVVRASVHVAAHSPHSLTRRHSCGLFMLASHG